MRGQVVSRGERTWLVRVYLGRDPQTGKRRYKGFTVHGTKKQAEERLAKLIAEIEGGTFVEPVKLTVQEWLEKWLESYAKPSLAPTTFETYENNVRVHIVPALGRVFLPKLTPVHVQDLLASLKTKGLAAWTVHGVYKVLHKALNDAVKAGLVPRNVADMVNKPKQDKKPRPTLDPEEARRFLEAAREDRLHALYVLAILHGLRRGELLGLRWADVDLEAGRLSITQAMKIVNNRPAFGEPKTARSRRLVELTPLAVEALRRHRHEQRKERLAFGPDYQDHGLVFCQVNGKPLDPHNMLKRSFKRLLKKAGITKDLHLHDLRHSCATLLLKQGVHPKVVQERLGHSNITMTLDLYSHVLPGLQREAGEKLEALLFGEVARKENRQG